MQRIMRVWADAIGDAAQTPNGKLIKRIFLEEPGGAYERNNDCQSGEENRVFYDGIAGTLFGEYAQMSFHKGDMVVVELQFLCRSDTRDGVTRYYNDIAIRSIAKI